MENILRIIMVVLTVAMENSLCLGGYGLLYGLDWSRRKKWSKVCFVAVIILFSVLDIWNFSLSIVNTFETLLAGVLQWLVLLVYTRKQPIRILGWTFLVNGAWMALSVPIVLIRGMVIGKGIDANLYPDIYWVAVRLILIGIIAWICVHKKDDIVFLVRSCRKYDFVIYYIFISLEWVTAIYVMNVAVDQVKSSTLVLSFVLVFCIILLLVFLLIRNQYVFAEKEKHLYESKEKLLRSDYELLREELNRNRKINHDHKYDLNYLYTCLENGSREQGMKYIEQKMESRRIQAKGETWVGIECVDVLLNHAKKRAEEENITFYIQGDIFMPPLEEYEFFAVLGNLLDNAIEAAEQCEGERRYVNLQAFHKNEMFFLLLENGYVKEPKQKKDRFLTSKEGEGHGYGIESVREMVERKGGSVAFEYGEGKFTAKVMFGL